MSDRAWEPLLAGALADEARVIVNDIVAELVVRPPSDLPGLFGDAATVLLLGERGSPVFGARLERTLVGASSAPQTMALFGGISGMAWLLHESAEGHTSDAVLEHWDAAIWRHLDVPQWHGVDDLLTGLAGVGVMLAARNDVPSRRMAERVLAHFEATAIESALGVTWRTESRTLPAHARSVFPDGMIDLGVAHGIAGVIGVLAQFVEADIEQERSRALLGRAVAWLLNTVPKSCPRFGSCWPTDGRRKRIGWCYGDTGIAAVLLLASRALDSKETASEAVDLLRQVAPILDERGAPDASFCHGAAGLAHVYNVAFQRTGDSDLRVQALRWLEQVIRMRSRQRGIAGYASLKISGSAPRWEEDTSLISGVVGTALVLLAALNDHEPEWQRLFVM